MSRPIVLLGSGGHARVVLDLLRSASVEVIGFADSAEHKFREEDMRLKYLGNDNSVLLLDPKKVHLVNGVGSIKFPTARTNVFDKFKRASFEFFSVIHLSAVVSKEVKIGEGVQIMAGAVVQCGTTLGSNVVVNTRASVDHDCHIDAHAHLAPGVVLSGDVSVGKQSHLGTGAIVTQGAKIPEATFVKAGALVTQKTYQEEKRTLCQT